MKTALVFSTKEFQNVSEYVAKYRHLDESLSWDTVKKWSDLCELLEVDITKWYNHARRALDKESEILAGATVKRKAQPISTSVPMPVIPKTSTPVVNPVQTTVEPKPVPVAPQKQITPSTSTQNVATPSNVDEVAENMAAALKALMFQAPKTEIDEAKVRELIKEEVELPISELKDTLDKVSGIISNITPKTLNISINNQPVKPSGLVHKEFEKILIHVSVRDNIMLVGPAGSGKTTTCEKVAEILELDFYCKSVCAQTSKAELLGYMDANGRYVSTEFRQAFEFGGVFVIDEIDLGNPNVLAVLNSALANDICAFADKMVKKHTDFVLIACANTFGQGADRQYVGRNQLDAATLDRFSMIEFGYDEALEVAISGDAKLAKCVQEIRKELANERVIISPRATIQGAKLLAAGLAPLHVFTTRISKGMPQNISQRAESIFLKHYPK